MASVPLDGFPPEFLPRCPKCESRSLHFQHARHPFMWGSTELRASCYTCGLVKYGEPAVRQAFESQLAQWQRKQDEARAFQVALEKERAERAAREAEEAARLRREQEARLAREQEEARLAREQEEAERKVREEQERIERERTEARIARERELARERAARWAEIEVMRKRDAERQANLQRELKRERDIRYREKKRARLAASPVAALPTPPIPTPPVAAVEVSVVEVSVVEEVGSVSLPMCAWTGCANHATPNSKYCSRTCSNNNAHARYKARRAATPPAPLALAPARGGMEVNAELRKEVLARKARYETRTTTESV